MAIDLSQPLRTALAHLSEVHQQGGSPADTKKAAQEALNVFQADHPGAQLADFERAYEQSHAGKVSSALLHPVLLEMLPHEQHPSDLPSEKQEHKQTATMAADSPVKMETRWDEDKQMFVDVISSVQPKAEASGKH